MSNSMYTVIRKHALKNALDHGKAILKAVMPKVIGEVPEAKDDIKGLVKKIKEVLEEVNKLGEKEILKELKSLAPELLVEEEEEQGLPDLKVKGKPVFRLAPFPSGAIHLGNTRGMIINDEYAKKYDGKLLLVIDDTIGSKAKPIVKEAYKLIPEALKWLKIKYDETIYKSDRLGLFYKHGRKLIEKDAAYVCECPSELIRDYRSKGIACTHRKQSVKENLAKWDKMLEGGYEAGGAVVRLKTDIKHKNPAFRDRVLFRISERRHERVGDKYHVWPMLEMSWAVDDMLLGVTHIIRGKELMIEGMMEEFIWDVLGYKDTPEIIHHGLFQVKGAKISKSKARKEVMSGEYTGWDDPRTWSVQSLKRRGFKPEAVREFILLLGLSKSEITVPVNNLYAINRRLIDSEAMRYFFVKDPVKLVVTDCPEMKVSIPLHHELDKTRSYVVEEGVNEFWIAGSDVKLIKEEGRVRLKDAMNIELKGVGDVVKAFYSKDQDEVYDIQKVQFVPKKGRRCQVLMPDGSYDKGLCEDYCKRVKKGDLIQFERYAFVKKEEAGKYIYTHN
ncbi:glutamate--tRNA ligase [archaeon]|nr:glutamate--tRNA ligase [archaeon]